MIRRRLYYGNVFLRIAIMSLPVFAFGIAWLLRFYFIRLPTDITPATWLPYWVLLLATWALWALASKKLDLCLYEKLFAVAGKTRRLLIACSVTYAPIIAGMFFYRGYSFSRLFILLSAIALIVLTWLTHVGFRLLLESERPNLLPTCNVLLVGADAFAARIARELEENQFMPCKVVGVVHLPDQENVFSEVNSYELHEINKHAVNNGFDDVVIAIPPARLGELPALRTALEVISVPIRAVLDFGPAVTFSESLFAFGSIMMLDLEQTPAESADYLSLKRAFDVVFSLFALIITSPLILLISLLTRLTSPGPIFFVQERVGLNGKLFKMYKFRTMNSVGHCSESTWTVADDQRRTRLGVFLRRTSLDEIPQFWNVLRGDMSVVGPRPERPYFVHKFLNEISMYNTRHYLKVGITGWAQVNGLRGDTSIHDRVEYDLYYMRNWSFAFDLHIILLTIIRGLHADNAY
jgi:Undecaprenyl-phosphate glucose phosphotransferase